MFGFEYNNANCQATVGCPGVSSLRDLLLIIVVTAAIGYTNDVLDCQISVMKMRKLKTWAQSENIYLGTTI